MNNQDKIFLEFEGDNWYERNKEALKANNKDIPLLLIELYNIKPKRVLEVGCNVGDQLLLLKKLGYANLWGIELQDYAVEIARKRASGINIVKGSAFYIPYKANFFDVVFTSGLLIHISPDDIEKVLDEIYRCTSSYIGGFENYTSHGYQMVNYRGKDNLLWKTDFSKLFLDRFRDLKRVKERKYHYREDKKLIDQAFLLKKIKIRR